MNARSCPWQPRVLHAKAAAEEVRVRPVTGWSARPDRSHGWQSVPGAPGELLFRSDLPPDQLRKNVTSPKGTTEAALNVLMAPNGMAALMKKAVAAAKKRSRELSG